MLIRIACLSSIVLILVYLHRRGVITFRYTDHPYPSHLASTCRPIHDRISPPRRLRSLPGRDSLQPDTPLAFGLLVPSGAGNLTLSPHTPGIRHVIQARTVLPSFLAVRVLVTLWTATTGDRIVQRIQAHESFLGHLVCRNIVTRPLANRTQKLL